ncbi:MAG TPA: NAD-dependent epimerase/dehydratase family protein [Candidatus Nanopelagicales bacterium]|jgi:nucleoside-diphosphate-sugar epimerase
MRLLVLGGTSFVGPAVVQAALDRGWDVTCLHRGLNGSPPQGAISFIGDRTTPSTLAALARQRFDVVVDAWSGAPYVARDAARALAGSTGRWAYVSTRSVYTWPPANHADESAAVVPADPDGELTDYAADKRGAELAYERELGADRVVHVRAGLILGPRENIGRLPWWLRRVARGGEFLAPGPEDLPLQYVDARDLASFALDVLQDSRSGPVNTVSLPGAATMTEVLAACVDATGSNAVPTWVDAEWLLAAGVEPWTELPIWIPREDEAYAMHSGDTSRAVRWGLRTRPVAETVADTWVWMGQDDVGAGPPPGRRPVGMLPEREAELLAAWHAGTAGPTGTAS